MLRTRLTRLAVRAVQTKTVNYRDESPIVSFSFDDAIETAYERGAKILEDHGCRGTFYVSGGLIGRTDEDRSFVTAEQVTDLHRRGHEIGCHTFSHAPVATWSPAQLIADADKNKAALSALTCGADITSFAFPYNATDLRAKLTIQRRYASCRGGHRGINVGRIDLGQLRAVELCDELIDGERIRAWVDEAARRKGWLIFFTHGVTEAKQAWRSTPALFESAVMAVRDRNIPIVTVRDALSRIALASN